MKTESCVPGDPVWTDGVEILSNDDCFPVIGGCQVSSILSPLETVPEKTFNNDIPQSMDVIILQNSNFKFTNVDLNQSQDNYMILKDDRESKSITTKQNDKNKPTNLEDLLYFVCNLCSFLCTSNEKISEHLQNAHSNKTIRKQQQFKCPACQNIFFHKISLRSHLIHDHGVSNSDINQIIQAVVYYAEVKTIKINEKKKIKSKLKKDKIKIFKANNEKLENVTCATTTAQQNTSTNVKLPQVNIDMNKTEQIFEKNEKNIDNNNEKKNSCMYPLCRVKMQDVNKLQYHINSHYDTAFKCSECEQEFTVWNSLAGHLWRIHKIDMELYSCDECDYRTFSLAKLNNSHKLIHTNVKNSICNICGKAFKNTKQMRNHRVIHKDKNEKLIHECEICSRKFADKRQVKSHIDSVHKKLKPFLCGYCGYKSASRNYLKMHMRQHTGEKPFSCDTCSYTTADHNSLRRHKLRHTGDKPYKCSYCNYACIQSSTYKVHLKTKHPGLENDHMFTCSECQFRSVNKDMYLTHMVSVHKHKIM